jgi:hypothetical protein
LNFDLAAPYKSLDCVGLVLTHFDYFWTSIETIVNNRFDSLLGASSILVSLERENETEKFAHRGTTIVPCADRIYVTEIGFLVKIFYIGDGHNRFFSVDILVVGFLLLLSVYEKKIRLFYDI